MKNSFTLLLIFITLIYSNSFDQLVDKEVDTTQKMYNPAITTSLSIIPGGGQFYTKHLTKGFIFLGMETIMGSQSVLRWRWYHNAIETHSIAKFQYDSLTSELKNNPNISPTDSILWASSLHYKEITDYDIEKNRISFINWSAWFGGIYVWNLLDGYGVSNKFKGAENPEPRRATLLSAIPFTGAGQFYNGNMFKGAMISVVEIGCMFSAINFQRLMNSAEKYESDLKALPDSLYYKTPYTSQQEWRGRYDTAARSRTMFMWYGVMFYLYGIIDAMVDANLHDFDSHFKIMSGVDPIDQKISFQLTKNF